MVTIPNIIILYLWILYATLHILQENVTEYMQRPVCHHWLQRTYRELYLLFALKITKLCSLHGIDNLHDKLIAKYIYRIQTILCSDA